VAGKEYPSSYVELLAWFPDGGEILVYGSTASKSAPALSALTPSGALDGSFGARRIASLAGNGSLYAVALAADGEILAAGASGASEPTNLLIARFSASGAPDARFDHAGAIPPPGTSSLGGTYAFSISARPGGGAFALALEVNTPEFSGPGPPNRSVLVAYTASAAPDMSFGDGRIMAAEASIALPRGVAHRLPVAGATARHALLNERADERPAAM